MTESTLISALKTQLEGDSDLSDVKNVFIGVRERIAQYPTLIIDYLGSDEVDDIYSKQEIVMHLSVTGIIHTTKLSEQVTDLLTLKNNILKAISSDRTLGQSGKIWTRVTRSTADKYEFFPVRAVTVEVEVNFRQDSTSR